MVGLGAWVCGWGVCGVCAGRGGEKVSLAALLSGYLGKSGHLPRYTVILHALETCFESPYETYCMCFYYCVKLSRIYFFRHQDLVSRLRYQMGFSFYHLMVGKAKNSTEKEPFSLLLYTMSCDLLS